jgi:phenylalanyl-tRNA synthetase beta chain
VQDSDTSVAGFDQPMRVAGLAGGPLNALQWGESERAADFFDAKGDVESLLAPRRAEFRAAEHPAMHPGRCAAVWLDGRCIGHVGELHPRWRQAYELPQAPVLFELELDAVLARPVPAFRAVSRHQPVQRDLALVVGESVSHDAVMAAIRAAGNPWLQDAVLFDVYRPKKGAVVPGLSEHEKGLAVRLVMNRDDATLADEQIEAAVQQTLASLQQRVSARLRA